MSEKKYVLTGENPHQKAELILDESIAKCSVFAAERITGPDLNYNDLIDCDSALALVREFKDEREYVHLMFHHGNPCGLALNSDPEKGLVHVLQVSDPTSIIEGIYVTSAAITKTMAEMIIQNCYLHVIIAEDVEEKAVEKLKSQDQLTVLKLRDLFADIPENSKEVKCLIGGKLIQDVNTALIDELKNISSRHASKDEMKQLLIAWKVVKHTKTNAIVLVKENATVGIGPGLNNRIWSTQQAIERAKGAAKGAVMASDAIIPLSESIMIAGKAGITAIIEPGGWIKEDENIVVADQYGIAMVTTGINQFKH